MTLSRTAGPPNIDWTQNTCRAQFDYIKVWHDRKVLLPPLSGTKRWVPEVRGDTVFTLTVQDPTRSDIDKLIKALDNPKIASLQLAVDIQPNAGLDPVERERLLLETFYAVAGRFRPEDEAYWAYGTRGGVTGPTQKPKPFHRRFPSPNEELVYGRRGRWMQSTMYLKRVNERALLDPSEHRVRMELTVTRWAVMELGLDLLADLLGYRYQKTFNKHFRIVSAPRVRAVARRSAADLRKLERRMWRGWEIAGVGKFAIAPELPRDTIISDIKPINARRRQQLPHEDYVLTRDQGSTSEIGNALRQLERRMAVKKTRAV